VPLLFLCHARFQGRLSAASQIKFQDLETISSIVPHRRLMFILWRCLPGSMGVGGGRQDWYNTAIEVPSIYFFFFRRIRFSSRSIEIPFSWRFAPSLCGILVFLDNNVSAFMFGSNLADWPSGFFNKFPEPVRSAAGRPTCFLIMPLYSQGKKVVTKGC